MAAGARSLIAEYGRRGDEEAIRARRVEASGALTRAEQLSAAALRRWWSVAGPDASLDDLDRILQAVDVYVECTAARDRAAARDSATEKLLERAVDEVGLEPGLDLAVTVDRLRHLVGCDRTGASSCAKSPTPGSARSNACCSAACSVARRSAA